MIENLAKTITEIICRADAIDEEEKEIYRERYECNTRIMELVDGISTDLTHELISINSERKLHKNII